MEGVGTCWYWEMRTFWGGITGGELESCMARGGIWLLNFRMTMLIKYIRFLSSFFTLLISVANTGDCYASCCPSLLRTKVWGGSATLGIILESCSRKNKVKSLHGMWHHKTSNADPNFYQSLRVKEEYDHPSEIHFHFIKPFFLQPWVQGNFFIIRKTLIARKEYLPLSDDITDKVSDDVNYHIWQGRRFLHYFHRLFVFLNIILIPCDDLMFALAVCNSCFMDLNSPFRFFFKSSINAFYTLISIS